MRLAISMFSSSLWVRLGLTGAAFCGAVLAVFNASAEPGHLVLKPHEAAAWVLHPVLASPAAADRRLRSQARWVAAESRIEVPPRSAVVFVAP